MKKMSEMIRNSIKSCDVSEETKRRFLAFVDGPEIIKVFSHLAQSLKVPPCIDVDLRVEEEGIF